jgi:hypothetical protein
MKGSDAAVEDIRSHWFQFHLSDSHLGYSFRACLERHLSSSNTVVTSSFTLSAIACIAKVRLREILKKKERDV